METIEDIRREEGNPRSGAVGGPPRSIFGFFHESGARLVAMLLMVLGGITLVAGAVLFVAPLMIAGLTVLILSFVGYLWARPNYVA